MSLKPIYVQAPGSKQTTIQIEIKANCTIRDVNTLLCSNICDAVCTESKPQINNPHQAAYLAYLVEQLRVGIQQVRSKKDNPIQMAFSMIDGVFIATISFITDNASFRLVSKMMADKCFLKNIKPAIQMIAEVDKDFIKQYGRDVIEDSIKYMQKDLKIYVISKMPKNKFEGGKDAFGTKILTQKFNDAADKVEVPKNNPIPTKGVEINMDIYTKTFIELGMVNEIHRAMLLAALNGQKIEYVVSKRELRTKQKDLPNSGKELCFKFMKERLAYTKSERKKLYKDLTPDQKKKMNEREFDQKMSIQREKKDMALIQTLSQSGGVPMELLDQIRKPLSVHVLNVSNLEKLKELLGTLVKNKK